jgi:hypothetical protein
MEWLMLILYMYTLSLWGFLDGMFGKSLVTHSTMIYRTRNYTSTVALNSAIQSAFLS